MQRKPFFYDITLRDGNQSLKKPWSLDEKIVIFVHEKTALTKQGGESIL